MNYVRLALATLVAVSSCGQAVSVELTRPAPNDARIRLVNYKPQEVTLIKVRRGTVTRITLGVDEHIEVPVTGLSARCDDAADEWCISAVKGSNQIFVRPRDGATRNNMELQTSKRDYSFDFEVLPDASGADKVIAKKNGDINAPYFRVVFSYSPPAPDAVLALNDRERAAAVTGLLKRLDSPLDRSAVADAGLTPTERLKAETIGIRNASYTKQVLKDGEDADPSAVFDDGRFTYFEFLGAREIPAIFAYGSDGEATRVNWHMQPPFIVVQRLARKFTLRLGSAVVGVFNERFDATGVDTPLATVSVAVRREIKESPREALK